MNPKSLCRFACLRYNNECPHNATDTTTIYEKKTNGINCDELYLKEHNGIYIPEPYCLINDNGEEGIFEHKKIHNIKDDELADVFSLVCSEPTFLNNSFVDPHTHLHYLELCYVYRGSIITKTVSKQDVLTVNGIKGLTAHGLNVPESKARILADYYSTCISKSTTLDEKKIYSRFGWSANNNSFVLGMNEISLNGVNQTYLINDIQQDTIQSFEPVGTPAGWIKVTKGLLQYDNVRFVCYAATTTLILKILGGASFVVELVGDTSKGKTIMAQVAMSIYGNPDKLKMATSATKVFIERMCATCNDLPIFLDETSMMDQNILKELTYMVANERGKGRGKKGGGVEDIDRWKSILLTTGEIPLSGATSLGGQDVRTVSLYGGIGVHDPDNVEYFKDHMELNCGVIAPLIIQKILEEKSELQELYNEVRTVLKNYSKEDKTGVMGRIVDTYALIALAGWIFELVLADFGETSKNANELVKKMFCNKLKYSDGSISDRAFAIITDWIVENKKNFCEDKEGAAGDRYELFGNMSMEHPEDKIPYDYVDVIPTILGGIIDKKLDHPGISKRILQEWNEAGKIVTGNDGRNTITATIKTGMRQGRVIRLKLSLLSDQMEFGF